MGRSLSVQPAYTAESLNTMKIADIRALADGLGYGIVKNKKADIINEFLAKQGGE